MERLEQLIKEYNNTKNNSDKEILLNWIINTRIAQMRKESQNLAA